MKVRFHRVHAFLLQFVGPELVAKSDTSTFLTSQVQKHAAMFTDELHGGGQLFAAVAAQAPENVAGKALAMDAHVNRLAEVGVARHPGHMLYAVGLAPVGVGGKVAVLGRYVGGGYSLHQFLVTQAVVDQVTDGDNLETELLGHFFQLGHAGHSAVLVHNLDKGGSRAESCQLCQVHGGLGMASPTEYSFFLGIQGRDVPRASKVARLGVGVGQSLDGGGTVMGRDTRGAAFNLIYHDGKGRAQHGSILRRLAGQIQFVATGDRQRCAQHSPSLVKHKVHLLGRNLLGSDNKIAFVLAVFVVHHDKELAVPKILYGLFNRIKQGHVPSDNSRYTCPAYPLLRSPRFLPPSCGGSCGLGSPG